MVTAKLVIEQRWVGLGHGMDIVMALDPHHAFVMLYSQDTFLYRHSSKCMWSQKHKQFVIV